MAWWINLNNPKLSINFDHEKILLMKFRNPKANHLICMKPCKKWGYLQTSTGATAGFLNHQQVHIQIDSQGYFQHRTRLPQPVVEKLSPLLNLETCSFSNSLSCLKEGIWFRCKWSYQPNNLQQVELVYK